jgi:hypothetical protein
VDNDSGQNPTGACATCPLNQWGSAMPDQGGKPRKGKACAERRVLYMLRTPNSILPQRVIIPTASLSNAKQFFLGLASEGVPYWGAVMQIGVSKEKNAGGIEYGKASFRVAGRLTGQALERVKAFGDLIRPDLQGIVLTQDDLTDTTE